MLDQLLAGLLASLQPVNFGLLLLGSFLGLLVGALPGLSSPMAISVLVPLTYGMNPVSALMLLIGIYVGTKTGGSYSAILLRTPGTPAAAATVMDGHAMALRGRASEALCISIMASFYGGMLSWIVAVALVGSLAQFALRVSAADLAMLGILAITLVAALSGQDVLKGLISAALGLVIASIGVDELTGDARLTFGHYQLLGGLPFLSAIIGLFAVATVLQDAARGHGPEKVLAQVKLTWCSLLAVFRLHRSMNVGLLFGVGTGLVPGVGSDTAGWLSYAFVKRRQKGGDSDRDLAEGVAAPESANNAVTGGAAVPMLALGIPGDASTAIMLGALMLYGLQPGPLFFRNSPDVAYGTLAALGMANVATLLIAALMIRPFVAVLRIDRSILYGCVLVLALVGGFAGTNSTFDIAVVIGFGLLGYLLDGYGFSIPALSLGIILAPLIESNLRRALMISNGDPSTFVTSPLSALSIVALIAVAAFHVRSSLHAWRTPAAAPPAGLSGRADCPTGNLTQGRTSCCTIRSAAAS
jgi:putative tricarboxylic transport membrane protein